MRPVRSGFIITPSITMSEPGVIRAATSGKAAEEGSVGTTTVVPRSSGWPWRVIGAAVRAVRRRPRRRAEMAQHPLRVVAGRLALDHRGAAGGVEARQQDGRLDLRRGGRGLVGDRNGLARAAQGQGHPSALGFAHDA